MLPQHPLEVSDVDERRRRLPRLRRHHRSSEEDRERRGRRATDAAAHSLVRLPLLLLVRLSSLLLTLRVLHAWRDLTAAAAPLQPLLLPLQPGWRRHYEPTS